MFLSNSIFNGDLLWLNVIRQHRPSKHHNTMSDEAVVTVEQAKDGEYVTYEAYRQLENEYNKLKYGKECVRISKATGLTCEEVHSKVRKEYTYSSEPMTIKDNVTINHKSILDIIQRTKTNY